MSASDLFDRLQAHPGPSPDVAQAPPIELVAVLIGISRRTAGLKQSALAATAGVSRSSVERLERGEPVSPETIDKITVALGLEAGYYTAPRKGRPAAELGQGPPGGWPQLVVVDVAHPRSQARLRALAGCTRVIMLAPQVADEDADLLKGLAETIDFLAFVLGDPVLTGERRQDTRRRQVYAAAQQQLERLSRAGYHVVAGVTEQAIGGGPPERLALFGVSSKALDPGGLTRRKLIVDWRTVASCQFRPLLDP